MARTFTLKWLVHARAFIVRHRLRGGPNSCNAETSNPASLALSASDRLLCSSIADSSRPAHRPSPSSRRDDARHTCIQVRFMHNHRGRRSVRHRRPLRLVLRRRRAKSRQPLDIRRLAPSTIQKRGGVGAAPVHPRSRAPWAVMDTISTPPARRTSASATGGSSRCSCRLIAQDARRRRPMPAPQ